MTPYEYALRSHPEPELPFHTVWLYGWSNDAAFRLMQALSRKRQYQKAIEMLAKDWTDKAMWKRFADDACQEYLKDLKELEGMK